MPRDLFGDVTRPSISIGNRKWYTVPVSLLSHSVIVAALVALPILAPALMPKVSGEMGPLVIIDLVPPVPPPPPSSRREEVKPPADPGALPREVPDEITPEKPLDVNWQEKYVSGIVCGSCDGVNTALDPPPPPPPPPPSTEPMRVGGVIRTPQKTRHVAPAYPQMAILSRTEGVVIIEATIGADGSMLNAKILRSIPLLDQAALDAVQQWQFTPTLLNGVPVPVIMTVTVAFTLSK